MIAYHLYSHFTPNHIGDLFFENCERFNSLASNLTDWGTLEKIPPS
ncbi:hypothetical protein FDUTEX481_04797 [Tolypothrix sp. PCC 7601]|nr:hypothetical protein FDUTEX481_04797 [Tolypothrix sp. PCC 7601]